MIAIVTQRNPDGTYDNVGMLRRFITKPYKTQLGLLRSIRRITSLPVRVEIYAGDRVPYGDIKPTTLYLEASAPSKTFHGPDGSIPDCLCNECTAGIGNGP